MHDMKKNLLTLVGDVRSVLAVLAGLLLGGSTGVFLVVPVTMGIGVPYIMFVGSTWITLPEIWMRVSFEVAMSRMRMSL